MSTDTDRTPDATGSREVPATPEAVYALLTDLDRFAAVTAETTGMRWRRGDRAVPGARFSGSNRNGWRRWSTTCTVTDAAPGERFAFDVTGPGGLPVAHWRYELVATPSGCRVTESMWDRRPGWFVRPAGLLTGVADRRTGNTANIARTLEALARALVPGAA